jgi:glycosyltransferase involved in cell wall biosynthesis
MPMSAHASLRILYALGPGDVVASYRHWVKGEDVPSETSRTWSGQFFSFCRKINACAYAISSHRRREVIEDGVIIVENRPKPVPDARGAFFHLSSACYGLWVVVRAALYRADLVIVDSGTTHWFVLSLLALFRIPVVALLHNSLWACGFRPRGRAKRVIQFLDGWFWRHRAGATICVSPECERQVRELARSPAGPIFQCRCLFRRGFLDQVPEARLRIGDPLRILYAGRVERNKGVFDLLEMAENLEKIRPGRVVWEVCGSGSASEELSREVERRKLAGLVRILGRLNRYAMRDAYGRAHVVIIPTTSGFCEGMPMVAAEAVLSGRPVVSSRLSNAVDVLGGALIEAAPDDVGSYVDCICRILDDPAFLERHREACTSVQEQFYDEDRGLAAALRAALGSLGFACAEDAAPVEGETV